VAAEEQFYQVASAMEVWLKQKCANEFLHMEKMALTDIH